MQGTICPAPRHADKEKGNCMEQQNENRQGPTNGSASPEELDDLQKRVRAMPDKKWNALMTISGAILGVLCGVLLTYFSAMESIGMYGTIGALLLAMLVPRLAERRLRRSVQRGRVALMIALGVWIAASAAIMFAGGTPIFSK